MSDASVCRSVRSSIRRSPEHSERQPGLRGAAFSFLIVPTHLQRGKTRPFAPDDLVLAAARCKTRQFAPEANWMKEGRAMPMILELSRVRSPRSQRDKKDEGFLLLP